MSTVPDEYTQSPKKAPLGDGNTALVTFSISLEL